MKTLLRFYYYLVTSLALIYLISALQNILHQWLLGFGFTDAITLPSLLDLGSSAPFFSDTRVEIAVLVIGAVHYFLLAHDRSSQPDGRYNAIRAFFTAWLTASLGLLIVLALVTMVRNIDAFSSNAGVPVAAPLAAIAARLVALGLVQAELAANYRGNIRELFNPLGQIIAKLFALSGQWTLLVGAIWAIGQAIQSILQQWIHPLPLCPQDLNLFDQFIAFITRLGGTCTDLPPIFGALLTLVVIVGALYIYSRWAASYDNVEDHRALNNIDVIVTMLLIGITVVVYSTLGALLFLDLATGQSQASLPRSLLSTTGSPDIASYPFLGPWLAGIALLLFFGWRQLRRASLLNDEDGVSFAVVALSYPVAVALFWGASLLLGNILATIGYNLHIVTTGVPSTDWNFAGMLLIPGIIGAVPLWKDLRAIGKGGLSKKSLQQRVYLVTYIIGCLIAATLSAGALALILITRILQTPLDRTNYFTPYVIAFFATTAYGLYYHYNLWHTWDRF